MKTRLTIAVLVMFVVLVVAIRAISYSHPDNYLIEWSEFLQQPDGITCGPTSATMVLRQYGFKVEIEEVAKQTKTEWFKYRDESVGMTSPECIPDAMKHFGLPSRLQQANFNQLKYYVSRDRPCIVLLRSGESLWHYVVVFGYDEDSVFLADPGFFGISHGPRQMTHGLNEMDTEIFLRAWSFHGDMQGNSMANNWLVSLLKSIEVYPNTMIVPKQSFIKDI